jgi:glycerol uptake facilitator-like aquaporin
MIKILLAILSFVLFASAAEGQMVSGRDFGSNASDYGFAYILTRFFGLFLLVIGIMVFVRKDQKAYFDQLVESKEFLFIAGLITVILGALIVALNDVWSFDLRLLITILGWATLIKGAMMLILPEFSILIWKKLSVKQWLLVASGALAS